MFFYVNTDSVNFNIKYLQWLSLTNHLGILIENWDTYLVTDDITVHQIVPCDISRRHYKHQTYSGKAG